MWLFQTLLKPPSCGKEMPNPWHINRTWKYTWNLWTLRISRFGWLRCCQEIPSALVAQNMVKFNWQRYLRKYSFNSGLHLPWLLNFLQRVRNNGHSPPAVVGFGCATMWWSWKMFFSHLSIYPAMKSCCCYNHPLNLWSNTFHWHYTWISYSFSFI